MTKFTAPIIFLFSCFSSLAVQASTLLVSDIDDTIKVSHVLNRVDAIENSILTDNLFMGMNDVYQALQAEKTVQQFAYVTNAPAKVMLNSHLQFLSENAFPEGGVYLRESLLDSDFKVPTITEIIRKTKPSTVILIGDNGELDTLVYAKIRALFPQVKIFTFIHQIYSQQSVAEAGKKLEPSEIGFVTSVDLAHNLRDLGLLSENAYQQILTRNIPAILKEDNYQEVGVLAFAYWMDCRDFKTSSNQSRQSSLETQYEQKRNQRCSQPAIKL